MQVQVLPHLQVYMSNPITPLSESQTQTQEQQTAKESYIRRELVDVDIFADETLGGREDETISTRLARWSYNYKGVRGFVGRIGSKMLGLIQKDHGADAAAGDLERAESETQAIEDSGIVH